MFHNIFHMFLKICKYSCKIFKSKFKIFFIAFEKSLQTPLAYRVLRLRDPHGATPLRALLGRTSLPREKIPPDDKEYTIMQYRRGHSLWQSQPLLRDICSSVGRGRIGTPERPPSEIGKIVVEIWLSSRGIYLQRGGRTPGNTW